VSRRLVPLALAIALAAMTPARAQPVFKARSELVTLHVLVKDRAGAYVGGLTADAFRVFEGNRIQPVRFFATEDAPVTIGLVIDSSGSMAAVRDRVIAASAAFVESSHPDDEIFAVVFNDDVRPVLDASAPFTHDANVLRRALAGVFVPEGRTALHDAIAAGLRGVAGGTRDRRALVVVSDGGDNASQASFADTLTLVQSSNTVVYTIALVGPLDDEADPGHLKQLAETSGGSAFAPRDANAVTRIFQEIARDIRHGYTIGYEPLAGDGRPGFHRIRVDVQSPDGRRLETRTRRGYYAP